MLPTITIKAANVYKKISQFINLNPHELRFHTGVYHSFLFQDRAYTRAMPVLKFGSMLVNDDQAVIFIGVCFTCCTTVYNVYHNGWAIIDARTIQLPLGSQHSNKYLHAHNHQIFTCFGRGSMVADRPFFWSACRTNSIIWS